MFSDKVNVYKTSIFVAPNEEKTRQITIYSSIIDYSETDNIFVIPVPNIESIEIIDCSSLKEVFNNLDKNFIEHQYTQNIHEYSAIIVYSLTELKNKNLFGKISNGVIDIIEKYYSSNFGFIILKIQKSSTSRGYLPFAYTHQICNKLFVPLKQHHTGSLLTEELRTKMAYSIYSYNTKYEFNNCINVSKIPIKIKNFNFGIIKSYCKYSINKTNKNNDVYFELI